MNTPNDVKEDWQERRDLVLAVRERVYGQFQELNNAVDPTAGPDEDQQRRIDDLQFDLSQLERAFDEADQKWLDSHGSDPMMRGNNNG